MRSNRAGFYLQATFNARLLAGIGLVDATDEGRVAAREVAALLLAQRSHNEHTESKVCVLR